MIDYRQCRKCGEFAHHTCAYTIILLCWERIRRTCNHCGYITLTPCADATRRSPSETTAP